MKVIYTVVCEQLTHAQIGK